MSHFEESLKLVLEAEGLYLESASEKGGGAMMGVSLETLREWRKDESLTLPDLQKLTADEAREIYRVRFWNRINGDDIKGRLTAIAMLDQAINRGVSGLRTALVAMLAGKQYKQLLDEPSYTQIVTVFNAHDDKKNLGEIIANAQHHYAQLAIEKPDKFLKWQHGWLNRTQALMRLLY